MLWDEVGEGEGWNRMESRYGFPWIGGLCQPLSFASSLLLFLFMYDGASARCIFRRSFICCSTRNDDVLLHNVEGD
jgi:hypothetical protein